MTRFARSRTVRYVVVALIAYALAAPGNTLATDGGLPVLEQRIAAAETAIVNLQSAVTDTLAQAKLYADQKIAAAAAALQANIAAEAAARAAADQTLQGNIDAEATARAGADATLQNNINAEATARANGDASTLAAAKAYTDSKGVGSLSVVVVRGPEVLLCAVGDPTCSSTAWATAACPAGYIATGGGFDAFGHTSITVEVSRPDPFGTGTPSGWAIYAATSSLFQGITFRATAVCARVVP